MIYTCRETANNDETVKKWSALKVERKRERYKLRKKRMWIIREDIKTCGLDEDGKR